MNAALVATILVGMMNHGADLSLSVAKSTGFAVHSVNSLLERSTRSPTQWSQMVDRKYNVK